MLLAGALVAACVSEGKGIAGAKPPSAVAASEGWAKPSAAAIKARLTPIQFEVTQEEGTEPAFDNAYWNEHRAGLYVDVVTGEPLFSSIDKFESGTGWPSFTKPIAGDHVVEKKDVSLGMERTEVRSKGGDSHLGHVFTDGPAPTGLRYCINSAALRFIPVAELEAAGYGATLPLFGLPARPPLRETAILAGGCFWGMQEILRAVPGVVETDVGYTKGAESVRVVFDPTRLRYADLLENWYFRMHDPTHKNQQGNDVGEEYRSAIFTLTDAQRAAAEEVKARVAKSGHWKAPIVTEITAVKASDYQRAPEDHQDYLQKHPGGYSCHYLRNWTT